MKRLPFPHFWLLGSLVALLFLVACERPIPREEGTIVPTSQDTIPAATLPVTTSDPNAQPTQAAAPTTEGEGSDVTQPTGEPTTEPAAEATVTPAPDEPRGEVTHTVQAGETLYGLSLLYGVSVEVIAAANNLSSVDDLDIGQVLVIPPEGTEVDDVAGGDADTPADDTDGGEITHVVQAGENLYRIGLRYGFTVDELAGYNNLADPDDLEVGQVIRIPPDN